jgi:hypothetical protein
VHKNNLALKGCLPFDSDWEWIEVMFKKNYKKKTYDTENKRPVLRCSICTGEQVAGFKDVNSGHFEDIMLIRDSADLDEFMRMYGVTEITKEY